MLTHQAMAEHVIRLTLQQLRFVQRAEQETSGRTIAFRWGAGLGSVALRASVAHCLRSRNEKVS